MMSLFAILMAESDTKKKVKFDSSVLKNGNGV